MRKVIAVGLLLLAVGCSVEQSTNENSGAPAVVNGKALTKVGEYPASRSLVIVEQTTNGKASGFCTGVIIDKNIGLTAAHCFESKGTGAAGFRVIFGLSQRAAFDRIRQGHKFVQHPQFRAATDLLTFDFVTGLSRPTVVDANNKAVLDSVTSKAFTMNLHNDLAVFSFYGDLPLDAKPAQILPRNIDLANQPVYIYGAGHSKYMNETKYNPTVSQDFYSFGFLKRGKAVINSNYAQYRDFYFTAPTSESHTCRGDSGGPQFLASATFPTVVGLNSAMLVNDLNGNNKDSLCGHTALTAKVSAFISWIETQKAQLKAELK